MKCLYFIRGRVPTDDEAKVIAELGATVRSSSAYHDGDFLEKCDCVCGHAPEAYRAAFPYHVHNEPEMGAEGETEEMPTVEPEEQEAAKPRRSRAKK